MSDAQFRLLIDTEEEFEMTDRCVKSLSGSGVLITRDQLDDIIELFKFGKPDIGVYVGETPPSRGIVNKAQENG
jgi:hypothetical protein